VPEQDLSNCPGYGTLTITDNNRTISLPRCRVSAVNFEQSGQGRTIILSIQDRRWQFSYSYVTGAWNQIDSFPNPDFYPPGIFTLQGSPIAPGTYRKFSDLIDDCFAALGETNYSVVNPPSVALPVQWECEKPAHALQGLLDQIGYRLCYQPATDSFLVAPAGVGNSLPDNLPFLNNHPNISIPVQPNIIQIIGGHALFYDQLLLEPVGIDFDGTVRPLASLSYSPNPKEPWGGWLTCPPSSMGTVQATPQLTKLQAIELAKQFVWRTFRVAMCDVATGKGPGPNIAGYPNPIQYRQQIVLQPAIYGSTKELNGQPTTKPAFVTGAVHVTGMGGGVPLGLAKGIIDGNTSQYSQIPFPEYPTIDVARQIVTFSRQMFTAYPLSRGNDGNFNVPEPLRIVPASGGGAAFAGLGFTPLVGPPILYLNTSFKIQNAIGRIVARFMMGANFSGVVVSQDQNGDPIVQQGLPDIGCPPQALVHPELVYTSWATRDANKQVLSTSNNLGDLVPAAKYYIAAAAAMYETKGALDRTYAGVQLLSPDGAIQQVTWRVGGGQPCTTQASLNTEHNYHLPPYPERRRNEAASNWAWKNALFQLQNGQAVTPANQGGASPGPAAAPPAGRGW
jgi:hypothetical protein